MVEKTPFGSFWPSLYEPLRQFGGKLGEWLAPATEASSNNDAYTISMELPGVAEEDIQLTVENGVVTVSGEKRTEREEKRDTWYFSERQFGSFQRSFRVPADADEAAISAALKEGVLTITLPRKASPEQSGKRIRISTG